ncbi:unnamed protein product [Adineta ricciae]|uniref:Uncharacterized protein n=1 Tax=Adineta ricciae TaxID=249248 RepID=A0A813T704_ADIRI|nr:unnamed protein product [Adineta ricciae]
MKAALAIIFVVCLTGSLASDAQSRFIDQLVQQGQNIAQTIMGQLQTNIINFVQQAASNLEPLNAFIESQPFLNNIVEQIKPQIAGPVNTVLAQIISGLGGLIGGRASLDLGAIFNDFLQQITTPLLGIGQHLLNQGLGAVLGGIGGSRGFSDIFASLQQQIAGAVSVAQSALSGALGSLSALGSNILDASKPHWEQLQEQLVGHGLNVLGSLSETINNVHGSIVGRK